MIRIVRGPEPQGVIHAREEHLSRAWLEGGADGPTKIAGYNIARAELYARQFSKCAYCESWEQQESQPVEHFRPRGRPSRIDWDALEEHREYTGSKIDEARFARGLPPLTPLMFDRVRWPDPTRLTNCERGYWWLAWTWENLVFGCQSCNGGGRKGSRFPLAKGSPALDLHDQPPGCEQPLLLDPTDPNTDPMDVIRFRWDGKHWRPFAINDDARAAWTIAVLGLDGPSLLTLYGARVSALVQMARAFGNELSANAPDESIRSEWVELRQSALAPAQHFLALTHDWLAETFRDEIQRYGLTLTRPFLCHSPWGDTTRQPPLPRRPALDGLTERLQHRVRMMRHFQGRAEDLRALLVDMCRERPSTTDDLVNLLGRPTALPDHLAALEGRELVCDPTTGCWSPALPPAQCI